MFFGIVSHANAATYYVRADGIVLAASKVNATSPNAASTSLNMAQVNAATFSAGDQVLFSSQGGDFTTVFTVPSGGSGIGSEITYANVPTETPLISTASELFINTNAKSNIIIQGLSVDFLGTNVWANGLTIGAGSNITLSHLVIDMNSYGVAIISSAAISHVLIDSVATTAALKYGIYLTGTASDITIQNSSISADSTIYGIDIWNTDGVTINNVSAVDNIEVKNSSNATISNLFSLKKIYLTGVTTAAISSITASATSLDSLGLYNSTAVTVNNYTHSGASFAYRINGTSSNITINRLIDSGSLGAAVGDTANNITINDSSLTNGGYFMTAGSSHDITYNRCSVTYANATGFVSYGSSYNVTHNNCISDYNTNLGFAVTDTAHDITYKYCEASYNGTVNVTSDGGGFIPHASATNVKTYYSLAHHNYNEGIGDVSSGTNDYYNLVNWANRYAVGDTFHGSTVATINTGRGNMYFGMTAGANGTFKNIVSGDGKLRERSDWAPQYLTFDYNLFTPLDDSYFTTNDGGTSQISWSTYHASNETHSQNADPLFVNATGNYTVATDFKLTYLSPAIDTGTTFSGMTSTTTDYAGNPIYGTPDIGAYEYQPPHNLVTSDTIDIGAGARIYANGKFRDLATTNSVSAHLKVTPSGGSFTTYDAVTTRPAYLDITNITNWTNTHKTWTEGNAQTSNMITDHTIGDLDINKYYTITVSEALASNITGINGTTCSNAICLSDGSGTLSFRYDGGYSTHTFDMVGLSSAPTPTNLSASSNSNSVSLTVDSFPNDTVGSSGYYFSRSGTNSGWIQTNSWADTGLSCGTSYTYSVIYRNGDGIETDPISTTQSTSGCGGGGSILVNVPLVIAPVIPIIPPIVIAPTPTLTITPPTVSSGCDNRTTGFSITTGLTCEGNTVVTITANSSVCSFCAPIFNNGSQGELVKELQRFLNKDLNIKLVVDGIFGKNTMAIVKKWQKNHGLVADGLVGKKTKAKMKTVF